MCDIHISVTSVATVCVCVCVCVWVCGFASALMWGECLIGGGGHGRVTSEHANLCVFLCVLIVLILHIM